MKYHGQWMGNAIGCSTRQLNLETNWDSNWAVKIKSNNRSACWLVANEIFHERILSNPRTQQNLNNSISIMDSVFNIFCCSDPDLTNLRCSSLHILYIYLSSFRWECQELHWDLPGLKSGARWGDQLNIVASQYLSFILVLDRNTQWAISVVI